MNHEPLIWCYDVAFSASRRCLGHPPNRNRIMQSSQTNARHFSHGLPTKAWTTDQRLLSASCTPKAMAQACRFEFENDRGEKLHGVEFLPVPSSKQVATLIWHHGVCEHKERYVPVFEQLANAGVAVYCYDVHGHGDSEPKEPHKRGWIRNYKHLLDDLYTFVGVVEQRAGGRLPASSTFLGGQSMGGLVAALGALRCQDRWAGLIVFSGAMGVVWTLVLRIQAALGNYMAWLMPRAQLVPAVDPDNLHPDKAVVQSFKDDPLIFKGNLRAQTGNELLKGIRHLEAHRHHLQLPVYVAHGTKDAVTDINAVQSFVDGVSSPDKTFNIVEQGYHEMLMGDERTGMTQGMIDWIKGRIDRHWQQQEGQQQQEAVPQGGVQRVPVAAEGPSGAKL